MIIDALALFKLITQLDGTTPTYRLVRKFSWKANTNMVKIK